MYQLTEEEVRLSLENTDEIIVANNAITYGNTIYPIRNIASVTIRKWKYITKDKMPGHVLLALLALGGFLLAVAHTFFIQILAVSTIVFGWFAYVYSRFPKIRYTYSLMIELNSGAVKYFFQYDSKRKVEEVVRKLQEFIERPSSVPGFVVYNNQTYNNQTHSNQTNNRIKVDKSVNNYSFAHSNHSLTIEDSVLAIGDNNSMVNKSDRSVATGSMRDSVVNTGNGAQISTAR